MAHETPQKPESPERAVPTSSDPNRDRPATSRAVFVISVAAELAGIHPQTLRIYERKGLIEPARTPGRSRRYSQDDITLLRRIQELTQAGVSLEGARRIIALEAELDQARERIAELEARMEAAPDKRAAAVWAANAHSGRALVPIRRAVVAIRRR